MFSRIKNR